MAANGDLLSPVLRELRTLLVTDREDPFGKEFGACPATSKSTNRPCQNPASKERRETARLLKESLDCHSEVRHDEGFYERLEEFFITIHCSIHRLAALQTFNAWKGRRLAATTKVLIPQTSDGIPMAAVADGSDDMADADAQSIVSDALSDTSQETISPGDESELGLATASSTSTAVTTPGIDGDEPGILSDSNESRPNTPTPASRRPAAPVMDRQPPLSEAKNPVPEPDQSELDEVLGQHGSDGPAVCIDIMRRFHSVKEPAAAATVDTEESPADELVDDLDQEQNPSRSDEVSTGPDACVEPLDISSIAVPDQPPTIPARSRFGRKIKESCKEATRHIKDAVKSRFSGGASGCSDRAGGGDEPQKAALSIRLSIRISSAELRQAVEAPHLDQLPSQT